MIWYDYYYLVLVVPALIISLIAQANVKKAYASMAKIQNAKKLSGAEAAYRVLQFYGINNVQIQMTQGKLTDHYDPRSNVIRLSPEVFSGTSIASVGIACHEAGHAAQHAQSYAPIKLRNAVLPVANLGSSVGFSLAILGYFMGLDIIVGIGVILFAAVVLFQLITLPVEFNASSRALKVIDETNMLYDEEIPKARKVLRAAAMTYVASLLVSVMSLIRLVLRTNRRR